MILWFDYNVMPMDVVNLVTFYLVTISEATNEFLPGDYPLATGSLDPYTVKSQTACDRPPDRWQLWMWPLLL